MKAIPEGFNTITPSLCVHGAAQAIELYTKALGAKELYRMESPDKGKIMHACLQIGSSKLFLSDVNPKMGSPEPTASSFYLYVDNVDSAFKQAKQNGMDELFPVTDMFWGDRTGSLKDKFGNKWVLATQTREVSKEEMEEGRKKWLEKV